MKNSIKKVILTLIILMICLSIHTQIFALSGIVSAGKSFIAEGEAQSSPIKDTASLKSLSGYLYNILLAAGVVIAVVVTTMLGVQFVIGGAEGQAKVKEMLVPFIVGCVIVFGGFGFWKIAISVGEMLENTGVGIMQNKENIEIAYYIEK